MKFIDISRAVIVVLGLLLTVHVKGQQAIVWKLQDSISAELAIVKIPTPPYVVSENAKADNIIASYISTLHDAGFLLATADSLHFSGDTIFIELQTGDLYTWINLKTSHLPAEIIAAAGFPRLEDKPFSRKQIDQIMEQILIHSENNGYPYAQTSLDSVLVKNNKVMARLEYWPGEFVTFAAIQQSGESVVSKEFLQNYLNIIPGQAFSRKIISVANKKLESLAYIEVDTGIQVSFFQNTATISTFLTKKNANRIDVLIGLQSDPAENRKYRLTGNADLDLANQFGRGERITGRYQNLSGATQDLKLRFQYPYLAELPIGIDFSFSLYKRDSSYIDILYNAGIQYIFEGWNYFKGYIESHTSNLLAVDLDQIRQTKSLPEVLDIKRSTIGIEYYREKFDYRFNPRRGFSLLVGGGIGSKRVKENEQIGAITADDFEFSTLYDSLRTKVWQYQWNAEVIYHLPLFRQSTIKMKGMFAKKASKKDLLFNDLYRLGGQQSIRGFVDESFPASIYLLGTIEYRLLFNRNSNIFLFCDAGWITRKSVNFNTTDVPVGIGTGLNLQTRVGVFSISYALGGRRGEAIDFNNGNIHFGMVSLF